MTFKSLLFFAVVILPVFSFAGVRRVGVSAKICKTDTSRCTYRCAARENTYCQLLSGNCEPTLAIGDAHGMAIEGLTWAQTDKVPASGIDQMLFCKDSWDSKRPTKIREKEPKILNPGCIGVHQTLGLCSPYYPEY